MMGVDGGANQGARPQWRWDVALSFAGAQREYVGQVAAALKARGVRCFYDADEQVRLWGTHLAEELPRIYAQESAVVVIFISADYAGRPWDRLERRAAFSRAVTEVGVYVLPARFDESELPGLLSDVSSIDLRLYTPAQFADLVMEKLRYLDITPSPPGGTGEPSASADVDGQERTLHGVVAKAPRRQAAASGALRRLRHLLWIQADHEDNLYEMRVLREVARVTLARSASEAVALVRGGGIDAVVSEIGGDPAGCALLADIAGITPERTAPVYFYGRLAQVSAFGRGLEGCGAITVTASFAELLEALERHEEQAAARAAIATLQLSPGVVALTEPGDGVEAIVTFDTGRRVGLAVAAFFRRPSNELFQQRLVALSSARDRGQFDEAWLVGSVLRIDNVLRRFADQRGVLLRTLDDLTVRPSP